MLDLHRLTLLREVWLHGGITAAARALSYSHSAISQQLAQLERETGTQLLERVGRTARLTPVGVELVRNTEAILAAVERAEADLATAHERAQGVVTLAAFASISRIALPRVLARLREEYPGLDVRIRLSTPEEAAAQLVSHQVDAVLTDAFPGTADSLGSGVRSWLLARDPIRCYLPEGVDAGDLEQLRAVPWVMEPASAASTQWALRVCRELGVEPRIAHESSDVLFHLRMVEAGLAAAFLPDTVVREAGASLRPSDVLPADQHRSILFVARAGAHRHPALEALRHAVERDL